MDRETKSGLSFVVFLILLILVVASVALVGCPSYSVYTAHKKGEAELAQAQQNRQITLPVPSNDGSH